MYDFFRSLKSMVLSKDLVRSNTETADGKQKVFVVAF